MTGYTAAVIVNSLLLYAVNGWPGWQAVPFLNEDMAHVVPILNVSLVAGIVANVLNLLLDRGWIKAAGELLTSAIPAAFIVRLWTVFPFDFDNSSLPWELIISVVLGFALGGCLISIIVQLVVLVRYSTTQSSGPGRPQS
jgi:hypothetical protein